MSVSVSLSFRRPWSSRKPPPSPTPIPPPRPPLPLHAFGAALCPLRECTSATSAASPKAASFAAIQLLSVDAEASLGGRHD
jgi:hypothetical protein